MFDMMKMISFRIKVDALAATGGMMLQLGNESVAEEVSHQVLRQILIAGIDPDDVVEGTVDREIEFYIPVSYAMIVAQTLMENTEGENAKGVHYLMKAWHPCMDEIKLFVHGERYPDLPQAPFDELGNCMN